MTRFFFKIKYLNYLILFPLLLKYILCLKKYNQLLVGKKLIINIELHIA